MAINYQPMEPYNPQISQAYGAATVSQQNLPVLAAQARANVDAQLQAAAIGQRAAAEAGQQSLQQEIAQRALAQRGYEAQADRNLQVGLAEQHRAEIYDRAKVQMELMDHELSMAETMRLKRLDQAVSEVASLPGLDDADRAALIEDIKTEGRSLKLRQIKSEEAQRKFHADLYAEQANRIKETELRQREFEAKTLDQRTKTLPNPTILAQVQAEMGPLSPAALATLGPAAVQQREAAIMDEVARRPGGLIQVYEQSPGKWVPLHPEPQKAEKPEPFDPVKAIKIAETLATAEHPPEVNELTQKETKSAEYHKRVGEIYRDLEAKHNAAIAHPARPQPFSGTSPPPPPPVVPPPPPPQAPTVQAVQDDNYTSDKQAIASMNLPPAVNFQANEALDRMKELRDKYGSYAAMPPEVKGEFDRRRAYIKGLDANRAGATRPVAQPQQPAFNPRTGLVPGERVGP